MRAGFGLMCKPPRPGVSKTRLAAALGTGAAASLARAFLLDSAQLLARVAPGWGGLALAFHAPADAAEELAPLLPGWTLHPQAEGDLGARMQGAVDMLFDAGARAAVLVGTDAPTLPPALLDLLPAAIEAGADAAVIPALDGGYCAIALARPLPALFDGVPWSTAGVLAATRANADAGRLALRELDPWHDVDEAEDLPALRLTLDGLAPPGGSPLPPHVASHTRAALAGL